VTTQRRAANDRDNFRRRKLASDRGRDRSFNLQQSGRGVVAYQQCVGQAGADTEMVK